MDADKNISAASPSRRRFLRNTLATTLAFATTVDYSYAYEPDALQLVPVNLRVPGMPPSATGLRIGHLSDLHCDSEHSVHRAEQAVQLLLAQKPDVVFLTGDYITFKPARWALECAKALAPLTSAPMGVYAVMGNHDWGATPHQDRADFIAKCLSDVGIKVLRNQSEPISTAPGVWVVGLDDVCAGQQDVQAALKDVPESAFKILLVHEPDYADQSPTGFAFQLSGHSHGGQVRVPGLAPLHLPQYANKYYEGLNNTQRHPVYTTRGVGTVGLPIRAFCRPEVTLVTLEA